MTKNAEKLHVVFDCASQCQGASLNSACLQGPTLPSPTLPNKLCDILLMFRQFPHAVMADITAMYNQIQILPEDQDALSLIWIDDDTIAKYCMTSQLWCSSSSACAFNKTEELTPIFTVRSMMKYSLYVDNRMWSTPSVKIANSTLTGLLSTSLKRGFKLVKFIATNKNILERRQYALVYYCVQLSYIGDVCLIILLF